MLFIPGMPNKASKTSLETKKRTDENARSIGAASDRLDTLEKDFKQLSMMTESLWELLKQETSLNDAALLKKVDEMSAIIDAELNTKVRCPACRQSVPANKKSCYYCGKKLPTDESNSLFNP